jgi:hypothetical protein
MQPADTCAVDWTVLPAQWRQMIAQGMPDLAQDIADAITSQVREFRDEPGGPIYAAALRTVGAAVQTFLRGTGPGVGPPSQLDVFRKLGRREAEAGRSHDTLQASYRVASHIVMRQLLEWGREHPGFVDDMDELSSAVFSFIDHLARLSAEGFDAAGIGAADDIRGRALLVEALLDPHPVRPDELRRRAARLRWELPATASVVEVGGLSPTLGIATLVRLAGSLLGERALAGRAFGRHLLLAPGALHPADLRTRRELAPPSAWLCVGAEVPRVELPAAYRLVRRAAMLRERALLPAERVLDCRDHMLTILQDLEQDVFEQLARRRLAALTGLSATKRVKYGRVLSAWLELGSSRGFAPGVLDKHRQTLRYQLSRLEQMFGAQLADRDARVEIMLALRAVLPRWEAELAYLERQDHRPDSGE